jgi:phosphoenolpyruvate-protein kinase (PTS system EI component)
MTILQGIAASPGIGIGPVHIVDPEETEVQDGDLRVQDTASEQERFRKAIRESLVEVRELREKIALETGEEQARIMDAQSEILEDPEATSQTLAVIERERKPAAFAYRRILTAVAARLDEADGEYYRGRAIDVRDVRRRVLAHLGGIRAHSLSDLTEPSLIVANDLPPSEMALLQPTSADARRTPRSWRALAGFPRWSGSRPRPNRRSRGRSPSWTAPEAWRYSTRILRRSPSMSASVIAIVSWPRS